jgi:RNA polymerase sigma-70 factor (ECF subfamily)
MTYEPTELNSGQLVAQILAGDRRAEQELIAAYDEEITAIIKWRIGKNNPDWEDLKQEILAEFVLRLKAGQYDAHKGTLGAFLHSTLKFKIKDYRKSAAVQRRSRYDDIAQVNVEDEGNNPEEVLMENEERELLTKAIQNLHEPYKKILQLAVYQQLSVQEISKQLGLPTQKISNLKSYALTLLKNQF